MKKGILLFLLLTAVTSLSAQVTEKYQIKFLEINKENSDYGVALLDDNKLIYTSASENPKSKKRNYNPRKTLFVGEINSNGEVVNPTRIVKKVDLKFNQLGAAYTSDKKTVYLSRNLYDKKKSKQKSDKNKRLVLYKASVDANGYFKNIEELPFNKKGVSSGYPVLNKENTKLYFVSNRMPSMGQTDIFVVDIKKDGTYGKPRNLGKNVNTAGIETTPFLTDEGILYFSSDGHQGKGKLDVFAVEVFESATSEVQQLASPINSGNDDFAYIINKEKNLGFFTSNRLQGKDYNDLYSFTLEEEVKPEDCFISVDGKVKDKDTKNVISGATVELYDLDGYLLESLSTFNDGSYQFKVSCAKEYKIVASNDNYITDEKRIEILEENYHIALHANLNLSKIEEEEEVVESLQPIFYDYDDASIKSSAAEEMDRIVDIMNDNPSLVLQASSFTDSRGSDSYNMELSQRRLESAIDYLTQNGIDITRVKGQAYGEEKLVNQCVNGVECDEHAHEKNRRTEFNFTVDETKVKKTKPTKTERGVAKTEDKKRGVKRPVSEPEIVENAAPETDNSKQETQQVSKVEVVKPKVAPKEESIAAQQKRNQNKAVNYIEEQKEKIIDNLTALENKYEEVIAKNSKLLDSAVVQKKRISEFKKSVNDLEETGWSNIINYKIEIKNFNKKYEELINENEQRTSLIRAQKHKKEIKNNNDTGTQKKTALIDAEVENKEDKNLKVNHVEVVAIKVNSKGKYLPTRNPNKTDIIKVSFIVNRNQNVIPGEKDIHVVVQNPKGEVANAKGVFTDKEANREKKFTDHTLIEYDDKDVNVVFYLDKKIRDYQEGNYPVQLFLEGELAAVSNLTLENF